MVVDRASSMVAKAVPADLARRVASPGGTTEAGLKVLDCEDGLRSLVLRTVEASRRRGREMADAAGASAT